MLHCKYNTFSKTNNVSLETLLWRMGVIVNNLRAEKPSASLALWDPQDDLRLETSDHI